MTVPMKMLRAGVLFGALCICSPHVLGGIRPSFSLEYCSWSATDIVVATEGDRIDGRLAILETLKGDLNPGDSVYIPELAAFASRDSRLVADGLFGLETAATAQPKQYVTCSRMILFLKKKGPSNGSNSGGGHWAPADRQGISVSVLWIEGDESFAFEQEMNPGPSLLVRYGKAEREIKDRCLEICRLRQSFDDVVAIADRSKRARNLSQFVASKLSFARFAVFEELKKCGDAAAPVLQEMLSDPALLSLHGTIIDTLAKVAGPSVAPQLTLIVAEELAFWRTTAPSLTVGWWNEISEPNTETLRDHYDKLYYALCALAKVPYTGSKETVTELRDFWRSLPQLDDKSGLNQIGDECEKILNSLQ